MSLAIAAAQSVSIAGDLPANIARHLCFMRAAAGHGVRFLVFPELSLTGYEPALARKLAIRPDDGRLLPLRELARASGMATVAGAPLLTADGRGVWIGALILRPDGTVGAYTKQYLHPGENAAFTAGAGGLPVAVGDAKAALAVCADSMQPAHAAAAARHGPDLYAVGSVISENAYDAESRQLAGYAAAHGMAVLLANHGGPTGGWASAGRSAVWAAGGALVAAAPGVGDALVMATRVADRWTGRVLPVAAHSDDAARAAWS